MRAETSHTDDEEVVLEVVGAIPAFLNEVEYLHRQLSQRLSA